MSKTPTANASSPQPAPVQKTRRTYRVALAAMAALAVVAAVALSGRSPLGHAPAAADERAGSPEASSVAEAAAAPVFTSASAAAPLKAREKSKTKTAKARSVAPSESFTPPAPASAAAPVVEATAGDEPCSRRADGDSATPAPARTASTGEAAAIAPVTITGCLEVSVDDHQFRLSDTEGDVRPKSRSWRTAFLKKHSNPVDLVGVSDGRALQKQVGKKVAATGVLTDRSLEVSSVRVVAPHCN